MRVEFTGNWYLDAGAYGLIRAVEEGVERYLGQPFVKWTDDNSYEVPDNAAWAGYLAYLFFVSGKRALAKQYQKIKKKCQSVDTQKILEEYTNEFSAEVMNLLNSNLSQLSQRFNLAWVQHFAEEVANIQKGILQFFANRDGDCYTKAFSSNKKSLKDLANSDKLIVYDDFLHDYAIFNPGKNQQTISKLKDFIENTHRFNWNKLEKAQNKFLYSTDKFANEAYSQQILTRRIHQPSILLLTFQFAFTWIKEKLTFVHLPNGRAIYFTNKRIQLAIDRWGRNRVDLMALVLDGVLSAYLRLRAELSLKEIAVITYRGISQQELVDVEYIIVPKERAAIVADDSLRQGLDSTISYGKGRNVENVWLLERFLSRANVFDLLYRHVKDSRNPKWRSVVFGAICDAVAESHFRISESPFELVVPNGLECTVQSAKKQINHVFLSAKEARNFLRQDVDIPRLVDLTLATPGQFVNYILRKAVGYDVKHLSGYLTEYILGNADKPYWRNYALALAVSMMGGGGSEEPEESGGEE